MKWSAADGSNGAEMDKADLRQTYLRKRAELSDEDREILNGVVVDRFFSSLNLSKVNVLHIFLPIERFNEVDTWPIIYKIWSEQSQIQICAPKISSQSDELLSVPLERMSLLEENEWGIQEPVGETTVSPETIDLVVVPLLCFDERGDRVGYGKGYYDRFLAKCRSDCLKIGLSYFAPEKEIGEIREGDVRLDTVIFPR